MLLNIALCSFLDFNANTNVLKVTKGFPFDSRSSKADLNKVKEAMLLSRRLVLHNLLLPP